MVGIDNVCFDYCLDVVGYVVLYYVGILFVKFSIVLFIVIFV